MILVGSKKVCIIAECGVNHNGSINRAKKMIDIAKDCGVDFVKFQVFITKKLLLSTTPMAKYQKKNISNLDSQYQLLKRYELSQNKILDLYKYCKKRNVRFLATPFDFESLNFLNQIDVNYIKVSSGDLTNAPLLFEIAKLGKKVILSTGMSNMTEIKQALSILAYGYKSKNKTKIDVKREIKKYDKKVAQSLKDKVFILHCTTDYPAKPESLNLNAIKTLKEEIGLNIGYSDHSAGIHVPISAVSLGACIIEKHFTLNKKLSGPDHVASIDPLELKKLVSNIRDIEVALGNGKKKIHISERENLKVVRKGLYAKKKIFKGDIIDIDSVDILRPQAKCSPMLYWEKLGTKAKKKYNVGDPI